jgi:hypothetical protein
MDDSRNNLAAHLTNQKTAKSIKCNLVKKTYVEKWTQLVNQNMSSAQLLVFVSLISDVLNEDIPLVLPTTLFYY